MSNQHHSVIDVVGKFLTSRVSEGRKSKICRRKDHRGTVKKETEDKAIKELVEKKKKSDFRL